MGSRLSEFWASRITSGSLIFTSTRGSCPTASLTSIQNRFDNLGPLGSSTMNESGQTSCFHFIDSSESLAGPDRRVHCVCGWRLCCRIGLLLTVRGRTHHNVCHSRSVRSIANRPDIAHPLTYALPDWQRLESGRKHH